MRGARQSQVIRGDGSGSSDRILAGNLPSTSWSNAYMCCMLLLRTVFLGQKTFPRSYTRFDSYLSRNASQCRRELAGSFSTADTEILRGRRFCVVSNGNASFQSDAE